MSTQETYTDDEPIREAMLEVIQRTVLKLGLVVADVRGIARMETALEAALGVSVTVSVPIISVPRPEGRGAGSLIRVHGADRIRRFEWVGDQVSSLDVPKASD